MKTISQNGREGSFVVVDWLFYVLNAPRPIQEVVFCMDIMDSCLLTRPTFYRLNIHSKYRCLHNYVYKSTGK